MPNVVDRLQRGCYLFGMRRSLLKSLSILLVLLGCIAASGNAVAGSG
ncbi:MAG TPA: hypothetical protein VGR38_08720 [Candidatus Polarisedimenticolia bacterium]|nr:hypothetical protein [Candidatus Polarisedimenticolia bacterium]